MRPLFKPLPTLVLLVAASPAIFAQLTFHDPIFVRDSWESHEMKAGDFDGNSLTDFAYISGDRHLYIYWQQEDQSFDSTSIFLSEGSTVVLSMAAGDLNKDGLTDLVVVDNGTSTLDQVVVFISSGTGFSKSFLQTSGTIVSKGPEIADINSDGNTDIVLANDSNPFIVFEGSASGTFTRTEIPSSTPIHTFAVGDLNDDNLNDIVGLNYTNEMVTFIASSAGFSESKKAFPGFVEDLLVEDFSGDNIPDVIVGLSTPFELTYLLNDGSGNLTSTLLTGMPPIYRGLTAIDYDKDGLKDIFAIGEEPVSAVVLRNNGSGFTHMPSALRTLFASSIVGSENEGNEPAEIIVANVTKKVDVYSFDGSFSEPRSFLIGTSPTLAKVADMNKDGYEDFVISSNIDCSVSVLYGDAQNSYATRKTFILKALAGLIDIADFNGDSYPDLAYSTRGSLPDSHVAIVYSDSEGNLNDTGEGMSVASNTVLLAGDVNNDHWTDLVIDNIVLLGSAQGMTSETTYTQGMTVYQSALGDLNNDNYPDLVLAGSGILKVYFNDGAGNFPASLDMPTTRANIELELHDVNGDDYPDITIGHFQTGQPLTVFVNDQHENFDHREISIAGAETLKPELVDLNNDGRKDLLGNHQTTVDIFLQDEDGDFSLYESISLNDQTYPRVIESADVNGDGSSDLIVFSSSGNPVTILLNDMVVEPEQPTASITVSHIASDTANVTLESGSGTGRLVLIREVEAVNGVPVDNTFYTANTQPGMGDGIGEDNYVAFSGTALNFTLKDLKKNTVYHLAAFEFDQDSKNTYINYHPTGTIVSFKTKDTQTINDQQDITLADDETPASITITASSGLPVTLEKVSGDISIDGDEITLTGSGPVEVIAKQAGNNEFDAAPETILTFCVNPAVPAITTEIEDPYKVVLTSSSEINNQWFADGTAVAGETAQEYRPEINGIFTVEVNYDGCSSVSEATNFLVTSIGELLSSQVVIFPNPVRDRLTIRSTHPIRHVVIVDGLGKSLMEGNVNQHEATIDMSQIPTGLYILSLETDLGLLKKKITKKNP